MENNLQNQLKEIREKGALNVGFYSQIFKDKHFDNAFVYGEIMPQIVAEGFFENENNKKGVTGISINLLQARILDIYLEDIKEYEFAHLAEYFLNYKK